MTTGKEEQPLFTISPSLGLHLIVIGLIFLVLLPIFVFFVTLPVLTTGTFDAIWPSGVSDWTKPKLFFTSILFYMVIPFVAPLFRVGSYVFYENKLEINSFLKKKYIFNYNEINAILYKNQRIIFSTKPIPEWFENPIKYYKNQYLIGFFLTLNKNYYEASDIKNLNLAIEILQKKSTNFILK